MAESCCIPVPSLGWVEKAYQPRQMPQPHFHLQLSSGFEIAGKFIWNENIKMPFWLASKMVKVAGGRATTSCGAGPVVFLGNLNTFGRRCILAPPPIHHRVTSARWLSTAGGGSGKKGTPQWVTILGSTVAGIGLGCTYLWWRGVAEETEGKPRPPERVLKPMLEGERALAGGDYEEAEKNLLVALNRLRVHDHEHEAIVRIAVPEKGVVARVLYWCVRSMLASARQKLILKVPSAPTTTHAHHTPRNTGRAS
jgi:hypothetical protein